MATKRLEVGGHLSAEALKERMKRCVDAREALRWQMLWQLRLGRSTEEVAQACGFSARWVQKLVGRYNREGESALRAWQRPHPRGLKPLLDAAQKEELARAFLLPVPESLGGGLWSGRKVALWIREKTGRKTWPQQGWSYLRQLGFALKVPRPRHPQAASAEEAREWGKKPGPKTGFHSPGPSRGGGGALGRG